MVTKHAPTCYTSRYRCKFSVTCRIMFWKFASALLAVTTVAAQYPLEQGTVPNDQYTAAPTAAPLGTEGWRTGRSTFFDGSANFVDAYIARYGSFWSQCTDRLNPQCYCMTNLYGGGRGGRSYTFSQPTRGTSNRMPSQDEVSSYHHTHNCSEQVLTKNLGSHTMPLRSWNACKTMECL